MLWGAGKRGAGKSALWEVQLRLIKQSSAFNHKNAPHSVRERIKRLYGGSDPPEITRTGDGKGRPRGLYSKRSQQFRYPKLEVRNVVVSVGITFRIESKHPINTQPENWFIVGTIVLIVA